MREVDDIRCETVYRAIELAANNHQHRTAEEIVKDATVLENYILGSEAKKKSGYQTTGQVGQAYSTGLPPDPAYAEEYPNRNRGYEGGN